MTDNMISEEGIASERQIIECGRSSVQDGTTEINTISKETFVTDADKFRYHLHYTAHFTSLAYLHTGETQPVRPEKCPTQIETASLDYDVFQACL